ncbi:hypothetical protein B0H17DRAFT_1200620 [Mycena rosella]|uniref:Uncharacterized protein n=1 Tax=Mycena rosella TaxID=1033263 RepID=A0AAD7GKM3_MYCRO|nr:hypothetical protein B0H17DRAFT_1200620 [Mycena rosella]
MHSGAANAEIAQQADSAPFRNTCGRRGCSHIFEYAGPNPLENISRLVNEHWHVCPGRDTGATHPLNTRWEPRPLDLGESHRALNSEIPTTLSVSPPSGVGGTDVSQMSGPSASGTSASRSSSRSNRSTKSLPPSASASASVAASTSGSACASISSEPHTKKTSRSETERRRTLENDQWTMSVGPYEVVCRGCRRPIKLDRRSRYYPGLWEKHRDRCEHEVPSENTETSYPPMGIEMDVSSLEDEDESESGGLDPTVLTPRR